MSTLSQQIFTAIRSAEQRNQVVRKILVSTDTLRELESNYVQHANAEVAPQFMGYPMIHDHFLIQPFVILTEHLQETLTDRATMVAEKLIAAATDETHGFTCRQGGKHEWYLKDGNFKTMYCRQCGKQQPYNLGFR